MLIDQILEDIGDTVLLGRKLSDATIFNVAEKCSDFTRDCEISRSSSLGNTGVMVAKNYKPTQRLPFENIVIQFSDIFVWAVAPAEMLGNGIAAEWCNLRGHSRALRLTLREGIGISPEYVIRSNGEEIPATEITQQDVEANIIIVSILCKFLAFLSCKNIRYRDERPPAALQKARCKRGKPPLVSYKVLEVRPPSRNSAKNAASGKNLWSNRVHLCRGHMAEYGPEFGKKLLFGKYAGRFWIPPHARGNKGLGVVHKSYKLSTNSV